MSLVTDFLLTRKDGKSRTSTAGRLTQAARLLGYVSPDACPWETLSRKEIMALKSKLAERVDADEWMPASANTILDACRGVMREAMEQGLRPDNDVFRRAVGVPYFPQERQRNEQRVLTEAEMLRLRLAADYDLTPRGTRDQAFIACLSNPAGLRIGEYVSLRVSDIDLKLGTLRVRNGKGGKSRVIPLTEYTKTRLAAWIELLGPSDGPLWVSQYSSGRFYAGRPALDELGVKRLVDRLADKAQVSRFGLHAARRYAGTIIAERTGSDLLAARLLGHSRGVTDRYVQVTLEQLRAACEKCHLSQTWVVNLEAEVSPEPDRLPPAPPVGARLVAVLQALTAASTLTVTG